VVSEQPVVEHTGQRLGIDLAEQRVEDVAPGGLPDLLARRAVVAERLALAGVELLGQPQEVGGPTPAHEQPQCSDGQHRRQLVADVAGPRIGHLPEGLVERVCLRQRHGQGAHRGHRFGPAALRRQGFGRPA